MLMYGDLWNKPAPFAILVVSTRPTVALYEYLPPSPPFAPSGTSIMGRYVQMPYQSELTKILINLAVEEQKLHRMPDTSEKHRLLLDRGKCG